MRSRREILGRVFYTFNNAHRSAPACTGAAPQHLDIVAPGRRQRRR
jgi:hypothetical protein